MGSYKQNKVSFFIYSLGPTVELMKTAKTTTAGNKIYKIVSNTPMNPVTMTFSSSSFLKLSCSLKQEPKHMKCNVFLFM